MHRLRFDVKKHIGLYSPLSSKKGDTTAHEKQRNYQLQDEKTSERFAMISPLLADDLDPAKRCQIRSQIAENNNVSERTLYPLKAT